MEEKATAQTKSERWTAGRKADLVLELIKGQKTIVNAAREYDLKQSEIQSWIDRFMEYGRQGLRSNPKKIEALYEGELKAHREKIGELVFELDVLKKAKRILEEPEEVNSCSE